MLHPFLLGKIFAGLENRHVFIVINNVCDWTVNFAILFLKDSKRKENKYGPSPNFS